ncbi:MAG: UDP-N-acetylmuramoyl-tripeptide--D-alanyl-D-alanine ligase [Bacteroidales bacterium]|jgi:UDP-N-acetylmuramoyl-tripeptide--D-alanyl-D-alanine ligase|nr:UDP-N-acetylmuramoyl-tripeptide--D-alanyl-D-alanine ligase [Bacteroidales bacterium]
MNIKDLHKLFIESAGVTTDSRAITQGSIFFALKGDNFDGNNYVHDALKEGAAYAVCDNSEIKGEKIINVPDSLTTLQQLARYHREWLGLPLFALTGSNGKTTTKELITLVLSTKYNVISTTGNLNNHIGVPLTLLKLKEDTDIAVIEMGASGPGEIEALCNIALPDIGLITNVGKAHLLGFGSFDGVKKTKGELYDALLKRGGRALYNTDNHHLQEMISQRVGLITTPYGVSAMSVRIEDPSADKPYLTLNLPTGRIISTHLIGSYNTDNILAALAVGTLLGTDPEQSIVAIENYIPSNNRSQLMKGHSNTLLVDAYNANPTSMRAALENFIQMKFPSKGLILGDMLELGEDSQREHREILDIVSGIDCSMILFAGTEFEKAAKGDNFYKSKALFFETSSDMREYLLQNRPANMAILIKGSRGTRLEKVTDIL